MYFASDNSSAVPQQVLDAIAAANADYAMPYGADAIMDRVRDRLREVFEAPEAAVYLVATGTAANALALACYCPPWAAVYCHRGAHIEEDECNAPEFYTGGAKLVLLDGPDARVDPQALKHALESAAPVGVHNVQKGMLSLTNTTEAGAVYSHREIAELSAIARAHDLPVHLDGARFANALVADGCTPAEMSWKAGVDVLSFGGTKNGLMGVEAVIFFDPAKAWEFELRRKRGGHLFSKHRYLSAQMDAYLKDDLWLKLARQANDAAQELAQGLAALPGGRLLHPCHANMVFAEWPRAGHRAAREAGASYYFASADASLDGPADTPLAARLVCSWSTEPADVQRFLALARG